MSKIIILDKLEELISRTNSLPAYQPNNNQDYTKWYFKINRLLESTESLKRYVLTLENFKFEDDSVKISLDEVHERTEELDRYNKSLRDIKALLESLSEEVSEWENSTVDISLIKIKEFKSELNLLINKQPYFDNTGNNNDFNVFIKQLENFLTELFGTNTEEYKYFDSIDFFYASSGHKKKLIMKTDLNIYKTGLETLKKYLENIYKDIKTKSIQISVVTSNPSISIAHKVLSDEVFIVHGHDDATIDKVSLVLMKLKLKPIIVKNEASVGDTIIEKIERLSSTVGYGIIIYTACDIGGKTKKH